jgi:hypothetical protein
MNAARLQVRRVQSALGLALVGALLLLSVATGEARAATVPPRPSGDGDTGGLDDLLLVGIELVDCDGLYGTGKAVLDLGVPARIEDPDDAAATVSNPEFEDLQSAVRDAFQDDGFIVPAFRAVPLIELVENHPAEFGSLAATTTGSELVILVTTCVEGVTVFPAAIVSAVAVPVVGLGTCTGEVPLVDADDLDIFVEIELLLAAAADPLGCGEPADPADPAVTPVPSALTLSCEPTVVTVGQQVTCEVSGGDPNATMLWSASTSPAFAGQGVTLGPDGRGGFAFTVPASAGGRVITVELVGWSRSALVQVAGAPLVPTGVPAGEGNGPLRGSLLVAAGLLSMALVRSRNGRSTVGLDG